MKKIISYALISSFILFGYASFTYAQADVTVQTQTEVKSGEELKIKNESNGSASLRAKAEQDRMAKEKERKDQLEQKKADFVEKQQERKTENQEKRDEAKKDRTENRETMLKLRMEGHLKLIVARFEATIERLGNIIGRVESRMGKMKEKGENTEKAEASIVIAKENLQKAKDSLVVFKNSVNAEIGSTIETPLGTKISEMRKLTEETKNYLRESHKATVQAVIYLKASSTVETTN